MGILEDYIKKRNYYSRIEDRLKKAYKKITPIKKNYREQKKSIERVTRGMSWKGSTKDKFSRIIEEASRLANSQEKSIDRIHDGINTEATKARNNGRLFGDRIAALKTSIDNFTN